MKMYASNKIGVELNEEIEKELAFWNAALELYKVNPNYTIKMQNSMNLPIELGTILWYEGKIRIHN